MIMKSYTVLFGLFTVATTSVWAQADLQAPADTRPSSADVSSQLPPTQTTPAGVDVAQSHAEAQRPFTVSATVREQYDDNIYTTNTNKVDQFESIIEPSFLFNYPMGEDLFSARYTFGATYYPDRAGSSFDLSHEFVARYNHSFSDRFDLEVRDRVSDSDQPEISSGAVVNRVAGSYVNNTFTLQGTAQWAPKLSTVTTFTNDYFTYSDPTQSQLNDRDVNTLQHDFRFLLTPTLTLVAGGTYTNVGYSDDITPAGLTNTVSRDWESETIYAGLDYNFTPQLTAGFRAGGVVTQYDASSGSELDPYAEVFANWQVGARSSLNFDYTHTVAQTDVDSYSSTLSDNFSLTARYQFTPRFSGQLQGDYNLAQNQADSSIIAGQGDFQENTFGISFGLGYDLTRYLNLNMGYDYSEVDSDDSGRSYTRNQVSLGLTATY